MSEYPQYSCVGPDLVEFKPTCELRWRLSPTPGERPALQQLWRASSSDGILTYTDEHWRDVPNFEDPV
jgi:hypothetical protein